jgi:hypothetical protein
MYQEISEEEKKYINELTIKLINDVPVKEVEKWVRTLPEHTQVILVEAVDVMNKNLDMIIKSSNQKEMISKLLKGELNETDSKNI